MRNAIIAILLLTVVLAACKTQPTTTQPNVQASNEDLKKFSSETELSSFLLKAAGAQYNNGIAGGRQVFMEKSANTIGAVPSAAPTTGQAGDNSAVDYSHTNVQVQGVDEADIVKNDGKYIYTVSGNTINIVDAYPAENAKIVSTITYKQSTPRNIFVNGDKLIVFADGNEEVTRIWQGDFIPRPSTIQTAQVFVYDIHDRTAPKRVMNFSSEGYYYESRMIGDTVYFISNNYVDYSRPMLPLISGSKVMSPEAFYFDVPDYSYSFYTVASFNVNSADSLNAKSYMLGQSTTLFVSENAIYLASRQTPYWGYYNDGGMKKFFDAVVPVLPQETQDRVKALGQGASWAQISAILEDMYNSMSKQEQDDQIKKIQGSVDTYDKNIQLELSKTTVHKIAIKNGAIDYVGKGEVQGYPLNQFSMDENNGYFRIATTTDFWTQDQEVQHNSVYVLDSGMNVVGKLDDLAKGEKIYSARFIGDKLYLVTFKRIDPLFVIDLSNPASPSVLGELKIPGYSEYLHPYDENHIIGLGQDTKDTEWGGVQNAGLKLALFDISDVSNPKQVATYHINGSGTYSEAFNDHKAFLFDKGKNLLVIPVQEILSEGGYDQYARIYRPQKVWQGAHVFGLTPEGGFVVRGKITHSEDETQNNYYYGYNNAIRRALFMDDTLYTISTYKLEANDLNDLSKQLASIQLSGKDEFISQPGEIISGGAGVSGSVGKGIAIPSPTG